MTHKPGPSSPTETRAAESDLIDFLGHPSAYPGRPGGVNVIETHAARVFLAGDKAYKIKKPVRLPYLNFSTLDLRRQALARELEINQPHAPDIYLRLLPITRTPDGALALGGPGPVVEWALEMNRFEAGSLLSEIASRAPLAPALCRDLAAMIARYHELAPAVSAGDAAESVRATLATLLAGLDGAKSFLGPEALAGVRPALPTLDRLSGLLRTRATSGAVRRCHGDLHAGNIVLIGGRPVPFDALEFDEAMATTDVLYDLAFLLMDLWARDDRRAANLVLNAYVGAAPLRTEIEGLATLPLFLAMRALVRAVVAVARARQLEGAKAEREAEHEKARGLVVLAGAFLAPPSARLVAVGGFSGTGKSTLAAALAPALGPAPGAVHLRSDVERKRLFGVAETDRLSPDHYTTSVTEEVYRILFNRAERALAAGHGVIVDAVFGALAERQAVAAIAERAGRPFSGLWLEAPADTLIARVEARRGDASDADAKVVMAQLARQTGEMTWTRLDARGSVDDTLARAERVLHPAQKSG